MRNRRIVSILLILVSLAALLLLPAQVFAGNPPGTAASIQKVVTAPQPLSDPSKAVPDSTSYMNKADPGNPDYAKIQLKTREPTPPLATTQQYVHSYWGSGISGGINAQGVFAGQAARPNLNLPPVPVGGLATLLYAPTLILSNYCPVESVTIYEMDPGASSTERAWGVWNHPSGSFVVWKDMNAQFVSNYVRNFPQWGGLLYYTEILNWYGTYYVYLYNFNTGLWEIQYTTSSGSGPTMWGWDFWEIYKTGAWPTLPDIQVSGIRVYVNGSWPLLSPTYGYETTTGDVPYTKTWISQYDQWYVGP